MVDTMSLAAFRFKADEDFVGVALDVDDDILAQSQFSISKIS